MTQNPTDLILNRGVASLPFPDSLRDWWRLQHATVGVHPISMVEVWAGAASDNIGRDTESATRTWNWRVTTYIAQLTPRG